MPGQRQSQRRAGNATPDDPSGRRKTPGAEALAGNLKRVERAKAEWESTADSLPQLVCLLDEEGGVLRANRTVEDWGLKAVTAVKGVSLHNLFHEGCPSRRCRLPDLFGKAWRALSKGKPFEGEAEDELLGRTLHFQFRPIPSRREGKRGGSESFAVAVVEDVTERRRMEKDLERAREQEIEIGSRIQQSLLIDEPPRDIPGLDIAALTIPSQRIDGDFYAFFRHGSSILDILVGDVMGKGIPAALIGAATKNHFLAAWSRLLAESPARRLPEPEELVRAAHAMMAERLIALESFVTLCYARLDLERNRIACVDCGHPKTLLCSGRTGRCRTIEGENMPFGFSEKDTFRQVEDVLESGDGLLFCSDGVLEAQTKSGNLFGAERLTDFFARARGSRPAEIIDGIRREVMAHAGSERFADDLTLIAVKIGAEACEEPEVRSELELASDLGELRRLREFIRSFCRWEGADVLDEEEVQALELAADEATANVIQHAYGGRKDRRILVEAKARGGRVTLDLVHWGEPFDPEEVTPPSFDGSREGGFGVFIIKNCTDAVAYSRDLKGTNTIRLVKKGKKERSS